jgi:DNA-binding MarR family transcriptional regulator
MNKKLDIEKEVKTVTEYLERVLGGPAQVNPAGGGNKAGLLPVYLDRSYRLHPGGIQGQPLIFAFPMEGIEITPARMKKDATAVAHVLGSPVVFVVERLASHQRTRLIQQRVAFIVPGKQLHIPFLVISLTDKEEKFRLPKQEKLRPASQVLLLYHLGKERLESFNYQTIAERIGYSAMTVKRAVEELEAYDLARKEGKNEKFIRFTAVGRDLWDKSLPYFSSPVKIAYHINTLPHDVSFKKAGITALGEYTMLDAGPVPVYALYDDDVRDFKNKLKPHEIEYFGGGNIGIEVWNYDPAILSIGEYIDPLSLYLSLPNYKLDERTQLAKEELLNNHAW